MANKCNCNPEGLTEKEIRRKLRALYHGIIMAHGQVTNRRKRCALLETYAPCTCIKQS